MNAYITQFKNNFINLKNSPEFIVNYQDLHCLTNKKKTKFDTYIYIYMFY